MLASAAEYAFYWRRLAGWVNEISEVKSEQLNLKSTSWHEARLHWRGRRNMWLRVRSGLFPVSASRQIEITVDWYPTALPVLPSNQSWTADCGASLSVDLLSLAKVPRSTCDPCEITQRSDDVPVVFMQSHCRSDCESARRFCCCCCYCWLSVQDRLIPG